MAVYVCTNSGTHTFENVESSLSYLVQVHPTEDDPLWLDFVGTIDTIQMDKIRFMFNLHPLTVDDILNQDSSAKWELFDTYLFLICFIRDSEDDTDSRLSVVLGDTCILTFHNDENAGIDQVRLYFSQPLEQV